MKHETLSIAIITHNEALCIRACLESVTWADEIIVVDSQSSDDTVAICREYTDRVLVRPWPGFAQQKQFALDLCRGDWVLSLDADERVRPDLAAAIKRVCRENGQFDGYRIARRSYFLGQWIRHCGWYPGYQVRLFKRTKTTVRTSRVHEGFLVQGPVGVLTGDIDHFSHPSLADSLEKMNRYSSLEALDRLSRRRVQAIDFIVHPFSAFLRKYIGQSGYRDGLAGLWLCWIAALLNMVMYMKIWHLQRLSATELRKIQEERW